MQLARLARLLLPLLGLAACAEQESSTAPGGPPFDHTAGHKVVTSLADPGDGTCDATQCTLREAIGPSGTTEISFAPGLTGAITLAPPAAGGGPLIIPGKLSITGPSQRVVIRRRSTDPAFRIFEFLNFGGPVTLTNLIIRGGKTSGSDRGSPGVGGGIILLEDDVLRLINCVVAGNAATFGGGIGSFGTLTLTNSTVSGNSARFGGGGINAAFDATTTLTGSTVSGNSVTDGGGGGIVTGNRPLTLTNSTVSGNTASRDGGGIFGRSTLTSSTISGNRARSGGGILGDVTLTNSTVAGNLATRDGGGLASFGTLTLTNTLVALNRAPRGPDLLTKGAGTVTADFSLLGIGAGSGLSDGVNGNQVGREPAALDPRLGPLAHNGGPTRTLALRPGSPALDAASTPDCPTTDQRGVLRPQGAACDIGSFERE